MSDPLLSTASISGAASGGRAERAGRLPAPLTPFIGRERELARARALLLHPQVRLLTLTGPGGVGKTRLALRLAGDVAAHFAAGVQYVPLETIADPALILPTIAQSFGITDTGERPLLDVLAGALREQEVLLVLDNLEQVVTVGPLLADLLSDCGALMLLVTSRSALHVLGEQEYPVPALDLPLSTHPAALASQPADEAESVRLFVQRAQAVQPAFTLTADNVAAVREICVRLDGLPLAIELAAARCKVLTPSALLARLRDRLGLLTGGAANAPERQRTLRATIAWSYDLLSPAEQSAFRQLAVFVGGCSLEAAEAVVQLPADEQRDLLDVLSSLVDQSLLRQVIQPDGSASVVMLETIRAFGLEQLAASGTEDATRLRHAEWCGGLCEQHWREFFGPDQARLTNILSRNIDNLRAAMAWAASQPQLGLGATIAGSLATFWYFYGNWHEGLAWLERFQDDLHLLEPAARGLVLVQNAMLIVMARRDVNAATALCDAGLALLRDTGDDELIGTSLMVRGWLALLAGDVAGAAAYLHAALERCRRIGNDALAALTLTWLGRVAYRQGELDAAAARLEESLHIQRQIHNQLGAALSLEGLGRVARDRSQHGRAAELFTESLALRWEHGDRIGCLICLRGLADVALASGRPEAAARFLAATARLGELFGSVLADEAAGRFEQVIGRAREQLGAERFAAAWSAGQALTMDDAIVEARRLAADLLDPVHPDAPTAAVTSVAGLTAREIEILRLVADGRSNPEIATMLFISPRTVSTHITNILTKLDLDSRSAAAAYAARHGLA